MASAPQPQMGLGLISPDKMADLFEQLGEIKRAQTELTAQQTKQGQQIGDIHKAVYGNGEPSHDMRLESLEKQMTKRHALSAGIAAAASMIYNLAVSRLLGHRND